MRRFVLLLLAATMSFAALASAQAPPRPTADDDDGDGVPNAIDQCRADPNSGGIGLRDITNVQANGCPPPRFLIVGGPPDVNHLAKDPSLQAQCYYAVDQDCSFHATLTLSSASAKHLKLRKARIGDVDVVAKGPQGGYYLTHENFKFGFSAAVKRALKKADKVTVTLAATHALGSGTPQAFPSRTMTLDDSASNQWGVASDPTDNKKLDGRGPAGDGR